MKNSNQRSRSAVAALIIAVFALCSVMLALFQPTARAAETEVLDVEAFYAENADKPTLKELDPNDTFKTLKEMYDVVGEQGLFAKMKTMAEIADEIDAAVGQFPASEYDAANFAQITEIFAALKKKMIFASVNDEKFEQKDAALNQIAAARDKAAAIKTKLQVFEELRQSVIAEVEDHRDWLLGANISRPDGTPETVAGFYDAEAKSAVEAIAEEAIAAIGEYDLDDAAPQTAMVKVKDQAVADMNEIPRNDIERAIDAINDYNAAIAGNIDVTPEEALKLAREACAKAKDGIIASASDEVKKFHDGEISLINAFNMEDFVEPEGGEYTATVKSDDDVVIITAKLGGEDYPAFAVSKTTPITVKIYNSVNGAGMRNALKEVRKIDKKLGVAYFFYIEIYRGGSVWVRPDAADVYYEVTIDLDKFYSNYVANYDKGAIEKLFANIPILRGKLVGSSRTSRIVEADEYIQGLSDKGERSLVYRYYRGADGQGAVAALENCRTDGGKLMFTTTDFLTFAVPMLGANSLLTNPVFWLVVAAAIILLIIIIAVIVKNLKYKFKFITDGGTPVKTVKARKNECFAMPDPPTKEGYVFGGWYADKECTIRFIDTYVLRRKSKKIYAKWIEETVSPKYVKYYEKLRNEIMSYAKAGPLANMGVAEREVLARLFADKEGVYLNVALSVKKLDTEGYAVEDDTEVYEDTPSKLTVYDKQSFNAALDVIKELMDRKGLQNVGLARAPEPMSLEEREKGFTFEIENDRVAVSASDYYELLRVYTKSFALYDRTKGANEGDVLVRMYCEDDSVALYLALPVSGILESSDRFADTPALFNLKTVPQDLEKAYDYVDRVMNKNGLEKRNESANLFTLVKVEKGCGTAFVVTLTE